MKFSHWLKENTEEWVSGEVPATIRRQGHIERGAQPDDAWYADDVKAGPYKKVRIPLNLLITQHDGIDARDEPSGARLDTINKYASLTTPFPPVVVRPKDGKYWVSDGNHRVEAARKRGDTDIEALIPKKFTLTEMPYLFANNKDGFDIELEQYATFEQLNQRLKEILSGVEVKDKYGNVLQLSTPESKEIFINDLVETNSPNFIEWVLNKFGDKFKNSHSGRIPLSKRSEQETLAVQNWLLTFLK